jgi:ABC-type uncharacterized transport system involved in gliding motility auxiliary subunit
VRADLTENKLYHAWRGARAACSPASRSRQSLFLLLERGDEQLPGLRAYSTRVREMLEEFAARAPEGKLVLHVVDPQPFSEEEDRAEQLGLQPANVGRAATPSTSASPAPTASARPIA